MERRVPHRPRPRTSAEAGTPAQCHAHRRRIRDAVPGRIQAGHRAQRLGAGTGVRAPLPLLCGRALPAHGREHPRQRDDAAQGAQDEGCGKMTFQKKEEPLPIRGRRHHPERSSTLMRFPMRSYGYVHGYPHGHVHRHPHGYVHGHPHGDAHQIEGKQARRFMYMNRTQHLPRPSEQEQQPECRRPMEEEKE
ncbi:hypothetical protein CE159_09150 [Bifidobacterium longum]|nr:hypothetical protein CE159_09150 [Bifidobacterium longum]